MRQVSGFFGALAIFFTIFGGFYTASSRSMIDDPSEDERAIARAWSGGGRSFFIIGAAFMVVALVLFLFSLN